MTNLKKILFPSSSRVQQVQQPQAEPPRLPAEERQPQGQSRRNRCWVPGGARGDPAPAEDAAAQLRPAEAEREQVGKIYTFVHLIYWIFFLNLFFLYFPYSFFPSPPSQAEEGNMIILCFTYHSPVAVTSNSRLFNSVITAAPYTFVWHVWKITIKFILQQSLFSVLVAWWNTCVLAKKR